MNTPDFVIRGRRVVTPRATAPAAVHVWQGRIGAVTSDDDAVVMPGLLDTHVHINEPGRTEWEGFATATRAAAAGGVTTLVEMPLNSVPATTTLEGLRIKLARADGQLHVDVGFWGGV